MSLITYKKLKNDLIRCEVCAHQCRLQKGKIGLCGARQRQKDQIKPLFYGRISALNLDPIEKKPLFHFFPQENIFSFGGLGCNFSCANCQNYEISQFSKDILKQKLINNAFSFKISPQKLVKKAILSRCRMIANTYNEPTINLEFGLKMMQIAKKEKLKNVWVSNGYFSYQTLKVIAPYLDAINIDIKSFSDDFYRKICKARLEPVLKACKEFVKLGVWLEITTLIIPKLNDSIGELKAIAYFIKQELGDFVPWHISAFSSAISYKMQDKIDTKPELLIKAYDIGKKAGLKYVYVGNLIDPKRESTFCPQCKNLLIQRMGYNIKRWDFFGKCPNCGYQLEGVFQ